MISLACGRHPNVWLRPCSKSVLSPSLKCFRTEWRETRLWEFFMHYDRHHRRFCFMLGIKAFGKTKTRKPVILVWRFRHWILYINIFDFYQQNKQENLVKKIVTFKWKRICCLKAWNKYQGYEFCASELIFFLAYHYCQELQMNSSSI